MKKSSGEELFLLDEKKPSIREIKENKIGYEYSIPEEEIIKLDISDELVDEWQKITDNISIIFNVPVTLIMKVNSPKIEVFISSKTEGNPYHVGESEHLPGLYCNTVMIRDEKLLVPNALNDELWKNNPDVKLDMISYLGYPIAWPNGQMFGTICVLDSKENSYSVELIDILEGFKNILDSFLENTYNKHLLASELIIRKELEEKLKEQSKISEEKFRKIFEFAADGFTLLETDGTIIDVNESNLEKYGYDKDEWIEKNIREIIPYTDSAILEKYIAEVYSKKYISYETIAQKKDGTQFNVEVTATLIKLEDREVIFAINRDITKRLQAEKALKENEEKYRLLFTNANDAIFLYKVVEEQEYGQFIAVNDKACKLTGYSRDELIQMSPMDLVSVDDLAFLDETSSILLDKKEGIRERVIYTKDGKTVAVEVSSHRFILQEEDMVMSIIRDITERKKAEAIQREAYSQLDKNIQDFAFLVDGIRNPLAVIQGSIDTKLHNFKEMIEQQIDIVSSITDQISDRWLESEQFRNILQKQLLEEV